MFPRCTTDSGLQYFRAGAPREAEVGGGAELETEVSAPQALCASRMRDSGHVESNFLELFFALQKKTAPHLGTWNLTGVQLGIAEES